MLTQAIAAHTAFSAAHIGAGTVFEIRFLFAVHVFPLPKMQFNYILVMQDVCALDALAVVDIGAPGAGGF